MHGYIGRTVEIIYMDRSGRFTQRVVTVRGAADGWVHAYCHARGEPRRFRADRILAMRPVARPARHAAAWAAPAEVRPSG
jgi:predicted DNA-binding transcriptional regulator YafY